MIGVLHAPRAATGAVMFAVCEDCGMEDRDAMVARGREAIIGLFEGDIRPLQIHEDVGHG